MAIVTVGTGVPTLTEEDKKKAQAILADMIDSLTRIDAERDYMKEACAQVAKELKIPPKLIRKVARSQYKASFDQDVTDNNDFEQLFLLLAKEQL